MNPHKWKKYSLGDTDISDKTNASAAFAFLNEIEKRKDSDREKHVDEDAMDSIDDNKITFKRKSSNLNEKQRSSLKRSIALREEIQPDDNDEDASDHKSVLKGSKVLMPEYVIGQKTAKIKKSSSKQHKTISTEQSEGENTKKLHLQHLFEYNDDDN